MYKRPMRYAIGLAGLICIALVGACARVYPPDPAHDVDITAADGAVLKASYFSPGRPGPAILLIHQCNMDRHAWDSLTPSLTRAGIHVLSYDQRGFGATGGKTDQQKAAGDADAAYAFLVAKKDVDKTRIAAGGASCGVTFSGELAVRHKEIATLLLLSGWTTDASRAYFAATPSLAIFGAAADAGSDTTDIRQAVAASKSPTSMLKTYRGSAHGVAMFSAHPDLEPAIVEWLRARLR
jgi:pimeloyl-ACP methyl ester carboxylesterase